MHTIQHADTAILIFCKAPVPGKVKTRLTTAFSAEDAAEIHRQLSLQTIATVVTSHLCQVQLWCSPTMEHVFFQRIVAQYPVSLHQQAEGDLGQKMHYAISLALETCRNAIVIGCDCPTLSKEDFQESITALNNGSDIVLAPAEDGGYVLIGMHQPHTEIFRGITWGSSLVLAETRTRISYLQLKSYELNDHWDIDTPDDLKRLRNMFN